MIARVLGVGQRHPRPRDPLQGLARGDPVGRRPRRLDRHPAPDRRLLDRCAAPMAPTSAAGSRWASLVSSIAARSSPTRRRRRRIPPPRRPGPGPAGGRPGLAAASPSGLRSTPGAARCRAIGFARRRPSGEQRGPMGRHRCGQKPAPDPPQLSIPGRPDRRQLRGGSPECAALGGQKPGSGPRRRPPIARRSTARSGRSAG